MPAASLGCLQAPRTSTQPATKRGFPQPSHIWYFAKKTLYSKKQYTYNYHFTIKYKNKQPDKEVQMVRSVHRSFCTCRVIVYYCPGSWYVHEPASFSESWVQSFYWEFIT